MKKVLIALLVIIAGFLAFVTTRPGSFHIERSTTIHAAPEVVFTSLADFRQWGAWSPWEKLDPAMKKTFEGPESGVGASYHWVGNDQVGEGRMTIVESTPGEKLGIQLEFLKPWEATNLSTFALAKQNGETQVTWSMDGDNNFMMKAMSIFMNMDQSIGGDFEEGLANLKRVAESQAPEAGAAAEGEPEM